MVWTVHAYISICISTPTTYIYFFLRFSLCVHGWVWGEGEMGEMRPQKGRRSYVNWSSRVVATRSEHRLIKNFRAKFFGFFEKCVVRRYVPAVRYVPRFVPYIERVEYIRFILVGGRVGARFLIII